MKKTTIKEIAQIAGLSIPAVSQVLNNKGKISRETRDRVLKICSELGYVPNHTARIMRAKRFNCLTLLMGCEKHSSYFSYDLLNSILDEASARSYLLNVARLSKEVLTDETFIPDFLRRWMSDGALITYSARIPDKMEQLLEHFKVPAVWINLKRKCNSVYPDDYSASKMATKNLLELGHKKIAYVDFSNDLSEKKGHYSAKDRAEGYRKSMEKPGLKPSVFVKRLSRGERFEYAREIFKGKNKPTAVIAYGSSAALCVMNFAVSEMKMRIPEDLSLVTFSDKIEDIAGTAIDTYSFSPEFIGREAVKMLLSKIEKGGHDIPSVKSPFEYEKGATCAPPRF